MILCILDIEKISDIERTFFLDFDRKEEYIIPTDFTVMFFPGNTFG